MLQNFQIVNNWLVKQQPNGLMGYNFSTLKKEKKFKNWELLRITRLSVMLVTKQIWDAIIKISFDKYRLAIGLLI